MCATSNGSRPLPACRGPSNHCGSELCRLENVGVAGEPLTLGSDAYGAPEHEDWELVRRLRAAGAIVVGITNVPELTLFPFTESTDAKCVLQ